MKVLTLVVPLFLCSISYAQITTTKVAEAPVKKYDSTENALENHIEQFIGQDLYLKGMSKGLQQFGYDNFVIDYTKDDLDKENIYKAIEGKGRSNYDSLVGKYFTVIDVIKDPVSAGAYFLKLQEKASKDILYYSYKPQFASIFPFITAGYFVKAKQMIVGKKFVVRGKNWLEGNGKPMMDMKTGAPVSDFTIGSVWNAVDLTVEEKYYTLAIILENDKHEQIPLNINDLKRHVWAFDNDLANEYKVKFGAANWQMILEGHVEKGMSWEMCELSWGKCNDITKGTDSDGKPYEIWTYGGSKLYFRGAFLTDFQ